MILDLILTGLCLLLLVSSAFFSGSETALFALNPHEQHVLRKRNDARARRAAALLGDLNGVLITVLVGNTFVNILLAVLCTRLFIRHLGPVQGPMISALATTAMILLFGEILPKSLAVKNSLRFSLWISPLLIRVRRALSPLTRVMRRTSRILMDGMDRVLPGDDLELREEDMKALFSLAWEEGSIGRKEQELVRGVFELGSTPVEEVMTPRVDLVLLEDTMPAAEAALKLRAAGYSQAPVYRDSPDHVVGIISAVDLLDVASESPTVGQRARAARFCPESQRAGSLLRELLDEELSAAVVLDEYGALSGLATLEDLFELLVGEILTHHDFESQRFFLPDENTLIASSRIELVRIEELLGVTLESETVETLGGYLMDVLGEVPEIGKRYRIDDMDWTVLSAQGPALGTLRLERRS